MFHYLYLSLFLALSLFCNNLNATSSKQIITKDVSKKQHQAMKGKAFVERVSSKIAAIYVKKYPKYVGSRTTTVTNDPNINQEYKITIVIPKENDESYDKDFQVLADEDDKFDAEMLGRKAWRYFGAKLDDEKTSKQCGALLFNMFETLEILYLGYSEWDMQHIQKFIAGFEVKAAQQGIKYMQFTITNIPKHKDLINLFAACGYKKKGTRPDFVNGGNELYLYKDISKLADEKDATNIAFTEFSPDIKERRRQVRAFFPSDLFTSVVGNYLRYDNISPTHKIGIFIKDTNGVIIGGACGNAFLQNTKTAFLYIEHIWVDSKFRKAGLGTLCMKILENIAKRMGCLWAHLNTGDHNIPEFYKKLGYHIGLTRPYYFKKQHGGKYSGEYSNEYDFYKQLIPTIDHPFLLKNVPLD